MVRMVTHMIIIMGVPLHWAQLPVTEVRASLRHGHSTLHILVLSELCMTLRII